jgi:hypothetical protein
MALDTTCKGYIKGNEKWQIEREMNSTEYYRRALGEARSLKMETITVNFSVCLLPSFLPVSILCWLHIG